MIRARPVLLALALALPAPAPAGDGPPGRLLAALTGDWNGDGAPDLVLLVDTAEGAADLVLYLGAERGLNPVVTLRGAVFAGPMAGQVPSLAPRTASSFVLRSEQVAIGSTPWEQTVTVAWRDGGPVVAGFTHAFYDRLDPERQGRCDVNLLTGGWEGHYAPGTGQALRRRTGRDGPRALALAELTEGFFPSVCQELFAE